MSRYIGPGCAADFTVVDELRAIQIRGGYFVFFAPIVLIVAPFWLGTALRHFIDISAEIAWVEVVFFDPGQDRHVGIFVSKSDLNAFRANVIHMEIKSLNMVVEEMTLQIREL